MDGVNFLFLITALLLFVSVVATRVSAKLGMPLLLVFLAVGMLAGEEGIGGINFDNYVAANTIGGYLGAAAAVLLRMVVNARDETIVARALWEAQHER